MRVGGINNPNKVINLYNNNKKNIETEDSKNKSKTKDSLEISSLGKSLSAYSTNGEIVNSSKEVEKIKEEISKGIYNRNSKLIADSILKAIKEQK